MCHLSTLYSSDVVECNRSTLLGAGTEWLADLADPTVVACAAASGAGDVGRASELKKQIVADASTCFDAAEEREVGPMRGARWQGREHQAPLHRSPKDLGPGGVRLLVKCDFITDE